MITNEPPGLIDRINAGTSTIEDLTYIESQLTFVKGNDAPLQDLRNRIKTNCARQKRA